MVIGIDPCHENLREISAKALKKPSKGGLSNLLFVLAGVENLPEELAGKADTVYINFPWGSLLQGVVAANALTCRNIAKICKPHAQVHIVFGYTMQYDQTEVERLKLPALSESYILNYMVPNLTTFGFKLINLKQLEPCNLNAYQSTWAKKLSFGSKRIYYSLTLHKMG